MSNLASIIQSLLRIFFGVKITSQNFNWQGIPVTIVVILISYAVFIHMDFFSIIDNLIDTSQQHWISGFLAKFSFISNSFQISLRSLFSHFTNPVGRFIGVFITQIVSFIGTFATNFILNTLIRPSESIPPEHQFIYGLLPFTISIVGFVMVRGIYNVRNFDLDEFLDSERR